MHAALGIIPNSTVRCIKLTLVQVLVGTEVYSIEQKMCLVQCQLHEPTLEDALLPEVLSGKSTWLGP